MANLKQGIVFTSDETKTLAKLAAWGLIDHTRPGGESLPRGPQEAMVIGVASGANGGKTGVFASSDSGFALYAQSPTWAGYFLGDVLVSGLFEHLGTSAKFSNISVTGDITMVNADCAEEFDVADESNGEPGMVMVVGDAGLLQPGYTPYDRRVAGVISGAGDFRPGMVLDKQPSERPRRPIALLGKVFCKVDASYGPIETGDLLTTSCTIGHAMRAIEATRSFGAVIGKALRPHQQGRGLIPILVALQ